MAEPVPALQTQTETPARFSPAQVIIIKIVVMTLFTLALGFAQGASSHTYQPEFFAGFHTGLLHGMLMPAALPSLLMGHDLPLFAPSNSGRTYKIGCLLGLNTCGTFFFGISFWQPRQRRHDRKAE